MPKTICGEASPQYVIVPVHVSPLTIEISSKSLHEQGFCLLLGGYFTDPGPAAPENHSTWGRKREPTLDGRVGMQEVPWDATWCQ